MPRNLDQHAQDTIDELFDHALELHNDGDGIAADLCLFSAEALALMNAAREQTAMPIRANDDELAWH